MLKPERVTFSADDDKFHQFANSDQLNSFLNDSLVHYSTDFKITKQQASTTIKHSNSLDEIASITMSSQEQQQQPTEHDPPASAPPSLISEENPILNENNLHQFDALTLQQLAISSNQNVSNINEESPQPTSMIDIQKEIDRVRQMKYGRTYLSPTSSLCSRLTINPFNGTNNNIDLSSLTHSVHFTEQSNQTNHLPFSSTYITSIPESIVPASDISSTTDNHFIPIDPIESSSLEDREVFETFHTKQTSIPGTAIRQSIDPLNRNITSSETDLIASLHRSASKQALDNQSEHSGTSDEMLFVEWDKERSLFQDYINSLRTEIRVLLQERLEYQKQMETINNNLSQHKRLNITQINTDETKLHLLQKSLEEKNLVLEQIQKEYEIIKEKNSNLTRKISNLRCDAKSQTGVIDELKQKIAELTVDIQNHILVKRRLEISMLNLENDCKIIDAERIRLNNDIKDTQLTKQDLEKLLQQANVQIAEQGSTIEMLRSDNIQIRSQLSTTQRRMLQEKQQVMDYLRQIENDLIEKEQIKQREIILRKDYEKLQLIHKKDRQDIEQFNLQINQDKQKLIQLEQERLQLLKTIENIDDNKMQLESELDTYKSATKRLYTHFRIPFDSIQSIDQLIPMLDDRYRIEQISHARIHHVPLVQSTPEVDNEQETEEIRQLREELVSMSIKSKQLDEANQAWQQYQQNQLVLLRDRLKLTDIDNLSFEDVVQQIENRYNDLNNQLVELQDMKKTDTDNLQKHSDTLQGDDSRQSKDTQTEEYQRIQQDQSQEDQIQNLAFDTSKYEEELHQLREDIAALTTQCAQLDEANRAWQQFHQIQLDTFRNKLQNSLPIDNSLSLDDIAQHIVTHLDQQQNQHENLIQQLQTSEKLNNVLRSESTDDQQAIQQTYANTINELNQKLLMLKQQNDQLETEKYILNQQLENQVSINSKQERNTPTPDSTSSESKRDKKQIHVAPIHEVQIRNETSVHSASPMINEHEQELQQLRDNVALLTNQCTQLNEANRAWQLYQQTQLHNFRNTIQNYLPIDETSSLDLVAQQIVNQITKEREDFTQRYHTLEQFNNDLQSESANDLEKINQLNQELLAIKQKNEESNQLAASGLLTQIFDETPLKSTGPTDQQEAEEIQQLRENLVSLTSQLDETNRAWQQYQQTQLDMLRNQLQNCLSIDHNNTSFDEIAHQIVDQVTKEREDFNDRYQTLEKTNNDLRLESSNNMESIQESFVNTINELNQELLVMKQAYDEIDIENQRLTNELEKQPIQVDQQQVKQSIEKVPSDLFQQPFKQVPIHTSAVNVEPEAEELRQLRESVIILTAQCAQLDEANRAWQQYHQTQLDSFRNKLVDQLPIDENISLDEIAQQIIDQMNKEREDFKDRHQEVEKTNETLRSESKNELESVRQFYINVVNELNQQLFDLKGAYEELDTEKQRLGDELEKQASEVERDQAKQAIEKVPLDVLKQPFKEVPIHASGSNVEQDAEELQELRENVAVLTAQCAQLNEANRAWQQYQQTQLDNFRTKLLDCVPIDESFTLDQVAQQIVDQMNKERNDSSERYQTLEKTNTDLQSESSNNMESIRESFVNTINELNQELLIMKEAYDQLDVENQRLTNELEKQPIQVDQQQVKQSIEKVSSDLFQQPFKQVPIHTGSVDGEQEVDELRQLQESVTILTAQCAQLDEANRAWQQYHQTQLDSFRNKLVDQLPIDENTSLDEIGQQIIDQMNKEREDFSEKYAELEKANVDLRSESATNLETIKQSHFNAIDELNRELLVVQEQYQQLNAEKQMLSSQLEKPSVNLDQEQDTQISESIPSSSSAEVSLQSSGSNLEHEAEELRQLRENFAFLTSQYAQLNEANRAWQEFHQSQLGNFREKIQDCIQIDNDFSFDQIAQEIVDQITKERTDFNERHQALEKVNNDLQSESIQGNHELTSMKEQYQQVLHEKEILVNQIQNQAGELANSNLVEQQTISELQEKLLSLNTQLDETNHSWQQFEQTQSDRLKTVLPFSNKTSLVEIIQEILLHTTDLTKELDLFKEKERNLTENLEYITNQYEQLKDNQYSIDLLKNSLQLISNENQQFKQQYDELQQRYDVLINENYSLRNQLERPSSPLQSQIISKQTRHTPIHEAQIHTITPVQSSSSPNIEEENELQQLRANLSNLTTQYSQLNEANLAWQQFHQNQIELFRNKLQDSILLDENSTLEQIAQQILVHLDQLDASLPNDSSQNVEELNQKSIDVYRECEEFREYNAQLILSKQQIEKQLEEREQLIKDLQLSNSNAEQLLELQQHNDTLNLENQQLQIQLDDMEKRLSQISINSNIQRVDSPRESIAIHNIDREREEEIRQLRADLATTSAQCFQLEEANRAWQNYPYEQIESFRQKLQQKIPLFNQMEDASLDLFAQHIIHHLDQLNIERDNLMRHIDSLKDEIRLQKQQLERPGSADSGKHLLPRRSQDRNIREARVHNVTPVQSASPIINEHEQELQKLRDTVTLLTNQCTQLDEANRAWQLYQQTQLDNFRNTIQNYFPIDETSSLDLVAQQIVNQITKEREDFTQRYHTLEQFNNDLQSGSANDLETINQLNQELLAMKQQNEQTNQLTASGLLAQTFDETPLKTTGPIDQQEAEEIRQLRENLVSLTSQLDETNRAWQQYQQTQLDNFRNTIQNYLPIDETSSLDLVAQQIVNQITKEREDFTQRYHTLEQFNNDLQSESANDLEKINQLNQELLAMKQKNEEPSQLAASGILTQTFDEIPLKTTGPIDQQEAEEIRQLRENLVSLTSQLDETNRAWQQYQQTQLDILRNQLQNCLSIDHNNTSFDEIAQQIVDQVTKEREDFNDRYQTLEKTNNDLRLESGNNMESIRESFVNTINELNQELLVMKQAYDEIDIENQRLTNELEKQPIQVDQQQVKQSIEKVPSDLFQQPFKQVPIHTSGVNVEPEGEELRQLRESVIILTAQCAQLDEANRAWQQYHQTQLDSFRNKLVDQLPIDENTSLDEIAQQIIDEMNKEREDSNDRHQEIEKTNEALHSESKNEIESVRQFYINVVNELNQQLFDLKGAYEELDAEKQRLKDELEQQTIEVDQNQPKQTIEKVPLNALKQVPIHTSGSNFEQEGEELRQLRESVIILTAQCAQLDEANRAWQQYHQTQLDSFRNKLVDQLPIDENTSLDEIGQQIIDQMNKEREDSSERYRKLEKTYEDLRLESGSDTESIRQSYINTVNELNQQLLDMKEAFEQLDAEKQLLSTQLEKSSTYVEPTQTKQLIEKIPSNALRQPFEEVPIHTSSADVEELRENVAALTAQCTQLDEANRAWQQYHQTQLDSFRNKLVDQLPIDENTSLDEIAQQIIDQINKEREESDERYAELKRVNDTLQSESSGNIQPVEQSSTDKIDELNEELLLLKNQYEELEKINKQLVTEKEELNSQLNDRSIVVAQEAPIELTQESKLQSSSPASEETEEIRQLRADLVSLTSQLTELTEMNQTDLNSFRNKLQNWISLAPNSTLDQIALQLTNQYEQQQQNIPETSENETQTAEPSEKVHIATETTRLTYENHQTQIDPIDMIDQQIQTESLHQLLSISDENLFNTDEDDDRLKDYIDDISALSSIDRSNRLNNDCQQILSKQNIQISSYPNLELNHLALITIYSLYNQHLTDDAKQLYNETLISALKQEYALISTEKNDYMDKYHTEIDEYEKRFHKLQNQYDDLLEQNELERLDSKQSLSDLTEKYEFNLYNLHEENDKLKYNLNNLEHNYQKIKENDYEKLNNEYQQLRQDFNDLINENELLKDYNSQMYQRKLQPNDPEEIQSSHDVDIQCNLSDELRSSNTEEASWKNDWDEEQTSQQLPIQEQGSEQLNKDEEINRLNEIISELKLENENLKDLNSEFYQTKLQNTDSGDIRQSHDIDVQTENEEHETNQTTDNDWNDQISPLEIPSEESKLSSIPTESIIKQTFDNETQTDEQPQDKLQQVNTKLKRALQNIKDKIHQAVDERPELFPDTGDDTIERLEHLIAAIGNQTMQIDILQNEREHAQREINQLQSSLEAYQHQIDNEHAIKSEQLVSTVTPVSDISQSTIESYEQQINQLEQKLSQNNDERTLLRERLNEVELELSKTSDDRTSTLAMYEKQFESLIEERDALVEQQAVQSAEDQHKIEQLQDELTQLKESPVTSHVDVLSTQDVKSLQEIINQQSDELRDLSDKYFALLSQNEAQDELDKQRKEMEERLTDYQNQIENLVRERTSLLEEIQKNVSPSVHTTDSEKQTDDQHQDKLVKVNNKLKRALQIFKDKINRVVTERPDLFANTGEETSERLDHLISTVEHQATQIDILQAEHNQSEEQLRNEIRDLQRSLEACQSQLDNDRPVETEQLASAAPLFDVSNEDHERQINQLQQKLSQNEDERTLLRERLNEIELELSKTSDDSTSTLAMYEKQFESLVQERDALVEQQALQSAEKQHEIEQLQEELAQLKQASLPNDELKSLHEIIELQSLQLKDLNEKYIAASSQQVESQAELDRQKRETEERLADYQNRVENLVRERTSLLEQIQKNVSPSVHTTDSEKPIDDQQHDKLVKVNNKLKRALQIFKDKINRVVTERPDLFVNTGEETSERLDHLISIVEHQATQIDILQAEHNQSEDQSRNEIRALQRSLEACQYQLNNERPIKAEQLVSATPSFDVSNEDYEKQINQLQQKLSQYEDERTLLRERLNEVELELSKTSDDRTSTLSMYEKQFESLMQERDALVEQQTMQSEAHQNEFEQLEQELAELKQSLQSKNEEIQSAKEVIEQQSKELKDLNEKNFTLSSQFDSSINLQSELDKQRKETEERLTDYENQIENLVRERTSLLEEIQKNVSSSVHTTDSEKQTGDQQQDKLVKVNNKLKRALQTFKDKINRIVTERPDLFANIGEETSERLDHLISIVEHQATQIDILQAEHNQSDEQLRHEIRDLQNSVEAYRYQIENERPTQTERLVTAAPPSNDTSPSLIEDYEKQINQLQQKLSQNNDERTLLRERLNEVELEFSQTLNDRASTVTTYEKQVEALTQERNVIIEQQVLQSAQKQHEIEQLQEELAQLKQASQPNDELKSLHEIIELQSLQLKDLNGKFIAASSQQVESQAELDRQKRETEERLGDYQNRIENLVRERTSLLEEIQKNVSPSVHTTDSEKQTGDQQQDKLVKVNNKLKRALQIFKDKISRLVTDRPDLFANIGEETSERLDHLISTVEHQATQIDLLQTERNETEERLRQEIRQLQSSFDLDRQQIAPSQVMAHRIETEPTEHTREIQPLQASNDNQWGDWFTNSPETTDHQQPIQKSPVTTDHQEPTVANRLFGFFKNVTSALTEETPTNDWDSQNSPIQFPPEEALVRQTFSSPSSNDNFTEIIKTKIQQIISEYPDVFSNSNGDILADLDQLNSIIKTLQHQIKQIQNSFDAYRYHIENEGSTTMKDFPSNTVFTQTFGLSIVEEHQKQIDELTEKLHENRSIHQQEIERLVEERDQIKEQLRLSDNNLLESQLSECQCQIDVLLRERTSLMEQLNQSAYQPIKQHVEIQTQNVQDSEKPISRQVFEQEILAWTKESDQLKQFVKQIQIENKKLKDIVLKLERITQDYTHENERLKQENQNLAFLSYSSTENSISSDTDICYLTLKWLTYEVSQRISDNTEPSLLITDDNEPYLKQRLNDTERQLKTVRIQNQRLKKQLETYTIQYKHVQHEINTKTQELSILKIEIDRLRTSESQYRLEVDRLKADLQCDQVKFQQLERELTDLKFERSNMDNTSIDNLRELLELKERELNALKEKLDYTIQAHQLELQEAIKSNQFSLDNVQRFEQLDQRHQEKRRELESRLGKICKIIKPLIDDQSLVKDDSIIDVDELQQLITDTEAEERVINSLGPIRDCLGLLESQMKDLHDNLVENHARRSKRWKYKLGFECLSCESQWEVTHDMQNLQEACQDPDLFLESSRVEAIDGCSCPILTDFIESDVRLCLDDMLDEIIVRTTVK